MLPNNGFFYFRFGSIVLSLIRIIGTVQPCNTFSIPVTITTGTVKCTEVVYYA